MKEFLFFGLAAFSMFVVVLVGFVYYAKKKGALRAAANVVVASAKQDVANAADKLTK